MKKKHFGFRSRSRDMRFLREFIGFLALSIHKYSHGFLTKIDEISFLWVTFYAKSNGNVK